MYKLLIFLFLLVAVSGCGGQSAKYGPTGDIVKIVTFADRQYVFRIPATWYFKNDKKACILQIENEKRDTTLVVTCHKFTPGETFDLYARRELAGCEEVQKTWEGHWKGISSEEASKFIYLIPSPDGTEACKTEITGEDIKGMQKIIAVYKKIEMDKK